MRRSLFPISNEIRKDDVEIPITGRLGQAQLARMKDTMELFRNGDNVLDMFDMSLLDDNFWF